MAGKQEELEKLRKARVELKAARLKELAEKRANDLRAYKEEKLRRDTIEVRTCVPSYPIPSYPILS